MTSFAQFCRYFHQDISFDYGPEPTCVIYGCAWSVETAVLEGVIAELENISTDEELLEAKDVSDTNADGYILLSSGFIREDVDLILKTLRLYLSNKPSDLYELNQQIEILRDKAQ